MGWGEPSGGAGMGLGVPPRGERDGLGAGEPPREPGLGRMGGAGYPPPPPTPPPSSTAPPVSPPPAPRPPPSCALRPAAVRGSSGVWGVWVGGRGGRDPLLRSPRPTLVGQTQAGGVGLHPAPLPFPGRCRGGEPSANQCPQFGQPPPSPGGWKGGQHPGTPHPPPAAGPRSRPRLPPGRISVHVFKHHMGPFRAIRDRGGPESGEGGEHGEGGGVSGGSQSSAGGVVCVTPPPPRRAPPPPAS